MTKKIADTITEIIKTLNEKGDISKEQAGTIFQLFLKFRNSKTKPQETERALAIWYSLVEQKISSGQSGTYLTTIPTDSYTGTDKRSVYSGILLSNAIESCYQSLKKMFPNSPDSFVKNYVSRIVVYNDPDFVKSIDEKYIKDKSCSIEQSENDPTTIFLNRLFMGGEILKNIESYKHLSETDIVSKIHKYWWMADKKGDEILTTIAAISMAEKGFPMIGAVSAFGYENDKGRRVDSFDLIREDYYDRAVSILKNIDKDAFMRCFATFGRACQVNKDKMWPFFVTHFLDGTVYRKEHSQGYIFFDNKSEEAYEFGPDIFQIIVRALRRSVEKQVEKERISQGFDDDMMEITR